jgi:methionyl-tRNA formyltransferase
MLNEDSPLVLMAGPGVSTNILYHALEQEFTVVRVIMEKSVSRRQLVKNRVKRLGYMKVGGQILFQLLMVPFLTRTGQNRIDQIQRQYYMDASPIPADTITYVDSVNSKAAIELLLELNPKVVVINGTRIISSNVLSCVPVHFINMHAGITPLYRGVHGGYWALYEKDVGNCGVTVHLVDQGIDTGGILYQERIKPSRKDTFVTYPYLQIAAGIPLIIVAVRDALAGKIQIKTTPVGTSRLYYHPTLCQYICARIGWGIK